MNYKDIIFIMCIFCITKKHITFSYKLEQVLILSRHNIRTPLTKDMSIYFQNKTWPCWYENAGYLTKKGQRIEADMGKYIINWLKSTGLLPETCPKDNSIYIYANTKQRTMKTADSFVKGGFPDCNVKINYEETTEGIDQTDQIFYPVVHNNTKEFREIAITSLQEKLNNANLENSYDSLDKIIEFKNTYCANSNGVIDCGNNDIIFEVGKIVDFVGPLFISNAVIDIFLMSFYEGYEKENVAWGKINTEEQWHDLMKINTENQNIRFNTTIVAKDMAKPLLNLMYERLKANESIIALFGHDSNLLSVTSALDFNFSNWHDNKFEKIPIGGKLMFEKWLDQDKQEELLKIEYIFQSPETIRSGAKLSHTNPPVRKVLNLNKCPLNKDGFCSWNNFMTILSQSLN